ncbi:heme-binding protein [Mycolicibacterium austroafricanum]|uniref:Heme-binding protein n=1 Tax=Mycolicibacterium austroafricanum TaxID=39687 RepID=A0ABT8HG77_MYCAO|nr:heme-binding protein [Mycolicibacterium austroafricanum]MDN4519763.1 heme-binding protein [Mycolicibacterium austroafricanum]QRZ05073.1 heme-binding protein [Mycolicibacterium austroafricanum]QZT66383.1 heme-binding protein [Mycolicibacterium austroafricanum]
MFAKITKTATLIVEGLGGLVGIRTGTEEPMFVREALIGSGADAIEVRRYGPRIAAQTVVAGDEEMARNAGFRRLAGYIFGGNHSRSQIAMTAPVAQQSAKIAMTAPVAQARNADGQSVIRFFMPSKWSMELLPAPDDERVELVEVPGATYAVLRFSGDRSPQAVASKSEELLKSLGDSGFTPRGEPTAWFYDPPWTLPFRRRNEVAVEVGTG